MTKTNLKTKIGLSILGLSMILGGTGCIEIKTNASKKITPEGIYECKPKKGFVGLTYRFNSEDSRTSIWWTSRGQDLEFYDLNSKEIVRLTENTNMPYYCECIEPLEFTNCNIR